MQPATAGPLLGEWACLGILYQGPAHGYTIAGRLKPGGDVGRVWTLSRPLTYRAIDLLTARGFVAHVGEEPGLAGGTRTILAATKPGRAGFRRWVRTPVEHLRDLRSELLLKLVLAEQCRLDTRDLIAAQRHRVAELAAALESPATGIADPVALWRSETANAAVRFLDRLDRLDRRDRRA